MAQFSASGTPSDLGFALLAIGVPATTTIAFLRIRSGEVQRAGLVALRIVTNG